jgi:hypothetical protein
LDFLEQHGPARHKFCIAFAALFSACAPVVARVFDRGTPDTHLVLQISP